jgi:uncharacterized protein
MHVPAPPWMSDRGGGCSALNAMTGAAGTRTALRRRIVSFLEAHHVMTLATSGPAGPWAAAVFYASDGLMLYFVSAATSRHCRDLEASGRVAATVHEECRDWRDIKGLQIEGATARLTGPGRARAMRCYGAKFPVVANPAAAPAPIRMALRGGTWYGVVPHRIRLIDNSRGFGYQDELTLRRGEVDRSGR